MSGMFVMCALDEPSEVNYTRHLLDIETMFDHCQAFTWLTANWTLHYYFIVAYLVAIFAGQEYMKTRPPFQLRGALMFWNVVLAAISTLAWWRLLTAAVYSIQSYGHFATSCTMGGHHQRQAIGLWLFIFIISKIVEFGDTVFIVLRKQPLIFLHWYHHVTVAFFVWSTGAYASPMHIYFCTLNYFVHSIMYSYFALKALRIRVPNVISLVITLLQVVQMVAGILVIVYMSYIKAEDPTCQVPDQAISIAASIYFSYFVLFLDFFRKKYMVGRKPLPSSSWNVKKLS